jgi:hypothetical protein
VCKQTDRLHCPLEPTATYFSFFVILFDSCIGWVYIWFVRYSTLLYIMHCFCSHSFRASANPLCLLHIEDFLPTSQSRRSGIQLLGCRNNFFVLCYIIVWSVKYNLLWVKWEDRNHMERSFVAYFASCPVMSRRVGKRVLMSFPEWISSLRHIWNGARLSSTTGHMSFHNVIYCLHNTLTLGVWGCRVSSCQ